MVLTMYFAIIFSILIFTYEIGATTSSQHQLLHSETQSLRMERFSNILHEKLVNRKNDEKGNEPRSSNYTDEKEQTKPQNLNGSSSAHSSVLQDHPLEPKTRPDLLIDEPKVSGIDVEIDEGRLPNNPLTPVGEKTTAVHERNTKNSRRTSSVPSNYGEGLSREKFCSEYGNNYRYFCLSGAPGTSHREKMMHFCTAYEKRCLSTSNENSKTANKESFVEEGVNTGSDLLADSSGVHSDESSVGEGAINDNGSNLKILDTSRTLSRIEIFMYCDKYSKHYLYYCLLPIKKNSVLRARLLIFCPSYEKICNNRSRETGAPTDPKKKPNDPFVVFQELKDPEKAAETLRQKKNPVPCKPDCDQRIWPHCTPECKCDYAYPYVQTFCNPPPMPLFLQTCRLWYRSCPKYEQFHYASQFVHSKADKGKVLPGITDNRPRSDPNIATMPIRRESPLIDREEDENWKEDSRFRINQHHLEENLHKFASDTPWYEISRDLPAAADKDYERENDAEAIKQTLDQNLRKSITGVQKNLWAKISSDSLPTSDTILTDTYQINDLAAGIKDIPINKRSKYLQIGEQLLRAQDSPTSKSGATPNFDTSSNVHRFDQFSDTGGLVHQAKTKSPFTKPGLWEPNPGNPHNRDPANKWYYAPYSYSADWLSGQLAWGGHWAVPAAGVGGTNGFSTVHFPSIGTFLGIEDDYD